MVFIASKNKKLFWAFAGDTGWVAADKLAVGDVDVDLILDPQVRVRDKVGELTVAFGKMAENLTAVTEKSSRALTARSKPS